jgi:hypothetical protein
MTTKRAGMLTALLAIALWVLGCGPTRPAVSSSPTLPPPTKQSPEQATLAWFSAVDHKDKAEAVADFEPSAADQTNWGNGNTSTWPTFSAIHCKPLQQKANTASVYCILAAAFLPSHQRPPSASFPPRAGCLALSQAPRARRSQGLTRLTVPRQLGEPHIWVADTGDNSVTEIDASTGNPVQVFSSAAERLAEPSDISAYGDSVWVTSPLLDSVTEIPSS